MNTVSNNIWEDGIMGVIIGDALGCPVQFRSRKEIAEKPVTTMTGYGTYRMPPGTWTDDSSMTLAALDSILEKGCVNPVDIMYRFAAWLLKGEYTPFGEAFDNGNTTTASIIRYVKNPDVTTCGGTDEHDNGNGSLMRIMPVCLYCYEQQAAGIMDDDTAVSLIHQISGLTHNHMRAKIACGLYYFLSREILQGKGTMMEKLQQGIDAGFAYYEKLPAAAKELSYYARLRDLKQFGEVPVSEIKSGGYVVDTLEAAVWSLIRTNTFQGALLTAVNLGHDTDTVGAVCGGLSGLFYGYDEIPEDWLAVIQRRDWIEALCERAASREDKSMGRVDRRERNIAIFKDTVVKCRDNPALSESIAESTKNRKLILEGDVLPSSQKKNYKSPVHIIVSGKRSIHRQSFY